MFCIALSFQFHYWYEIQSLVDTPRFPANNLVVRLLSAGKTSAEKMFFNGSFPGGNFCGNGCLRFKDNPAFYPDMMASDDWVSWIRWRVGKVCFLLLDKRRWQHSQHRYTLASSRPLLISAKLYLPSLLNSCQMRCCHSLFCVSRNSNMLTASLSFDSNNRKLSSWYFTVVGRRHLNSGVFFFFEIRNSYTFFPPRLIVM